MDGLKRVIQTKKEAEVLLGASKQYGMTVSGKVIFDDLGRTVAQGQPVFRAGYGTAFDGAIPLRNPTLFEYDVLDRTTRVTLPDASYTTSVYGFEDGYFLTTVTDPEKKVKKTLKDVRGNITAVKEKLGTMGGWGRTWSND